MNRNYTIIPTDENGEKIPTVLSKEDKLFGTGIYFQIAYLGYITYFAFQLWDKLST